MSSAKKRRDNIKAQIARQDFSFELGGAKSMATMWQAGAIKLGEENATLRAEVGKLGKQVISGFYEERVPSFQQGVPTSEMQDVVTAEEVTGYVAKIEELRKDAARYRWLLENCSHFYGMGSDTPAECGIHFEYVQSTPEESWLDISALIDAELAKEKS